MFRRLTGRAPALALAMTALVALAAAPAAAATPGAATTAATTSTPTQQGKGWMPDRIELPDGFLPEGIATGLGPWAWFGSRADGDIYRANLLTGRGEVVAEGPGTPSVGLKIDRRGRLFVAGGPTGTARVVDARTGDLLADFPLAASPGTEPSFVNDVVLTRHAAWFTDSQQAVLYRLPLGRHGALPDAAETIELGGAWEQVEGFNANGITTTPDGRALLVVNSTTGLLHRVDPATGDTTVVDLGSDGGDAALTAGDGMLLLGRTLFVVRNQLNLVAVVRLDRPGARGAVVAELTDPDLDVPTTLAWFAGGLYLPNARFTSPQEPTTEFWVTRLDLQR
ncbi:hypothetical protein GCM10009809_36380 [Isoptericola hypogeus]|uniref:Sugar lactone lactonase YvrE n=1 Tax=Isoptericola hypogeus TaxID=300179 RepID=A0ABP4VUI2_9MICO